MSKLDEMGLGVLGQYAAVLFVLYWLFNKLPASKGHIKRKLNRIRDVGVQDEARARLQRISEYQNSSGMITRSGLKRAIEDAYMIVRRDRRLAPRIAAQKDALRRD